MNAAVALSSPERFYDQARQAFEDIVRSLNSEEARSMSHSELERDLEKKGRELMRKLLQEHLQTRGPGQCAQPVRDADGVERTRLRLHERKLESIFGTVATERAGYGKEASRSLHPLDAELNLPDERYSLEFAAGWLKKPQRVPLTKRLRASAKPPAVMFPSARSKSL